METLSQMLEDYRNKERDLPNYEELSEIISQISSTDKRLIELSIENRMLQTKVASQSRQIEMLVTSC